LDDAVDLVQQGYTAAHAAKVSGFAASVITAHLKPRKSSA
jgi:hypothetical protein